MLTLKPQCKRGVTTVSITQTNWCSGIVKQQR